VVPQLTQLIRQAIIPFTGRPVDIPSECAGESGIKILPTIAPYLDVNSKEYIQHLSLVEFNYRIPSKQIRMNRAGEKIKIASLSPDLPLCPDRA
jgi:hypothetical protein